MRALTIYLDYLNNACENQDLFGILCSSFLWPIAAQKIQNNNLSGGDDTFIFPETDTINRLSFKGVKIFLSRTAYSARKTSRKGQHFFDKKVLLVPSAPARLIRLMEKLEADNEMTVITLDDLRAGNLPRGESMLRVRPTFANNELAKNFVYGVENLFEKYGIRLSNEEQKTLCAIHAQQQVSYHTAKGRLQNTGADGVLVYADNHPPGQAYVLAAQELNIPSFMLQHGLDCELGFLDEAYADHLMVWGPERECRYREKSHNQDFHCHLVGNPEYDEYRMPKGLDTPGKRILWCTRPHSPEKCYSENRYPEEGIQILKALCSYLKIHSDCRLDIKAHPYDMIDDYRLTIQRLEGGIRERVQLLDMSLQEAFKDSGLVLSEDSTAGLEAMIHGKPLIHVHFCPDPPSMPFSDEGGAILARDPATLHEALNILRSFKDSDLARMFNGQKETIQHLCHRLDGASAIRAAEALKGVLAGSNRHQ